MSSSNFSPPSTDRSDQEEGATLRPRFDADGLITAVATDRKTGELLMVAHMNAEALERTIETGFAHYWSRSRRVLWKKGETSGALQHVREMRIDCDQDAIWLQVDCERPEDTCHTGRTTCFYRIVQPGNGALETIVARHPAKR